MITFNDKNIRMAGNSINKPLLIAFLSLLIFSACSTRRIPVEAADPFAKFDTEAHRGGRGLMPENTIPAMMNALHLGVNTLEMDVHITSDNKVILAHDDHINPLFTLTENGKSLSEAGAEKLSIYSMNYAELRKFDTGSKFYDKFPQQRKLKTHMPLLADLIDSVQSYLKANSHPQVFYNIETKSKPAGDKLLHPEPETFVKLLMDVIEDKKITPYVIIQSFDRRTLQVLHAKYPHVRTSLLIDKGTFEDNLKKLGFVPSVYSPISKLVTPELVKKCHDKGIKLVPWTANTKEEILRLKSMGVDGIISDYPDLF